MKSIKAKMDSISGVYDDLNEKMHDVDKSMWVSPHIFYLQPQPMTRRLEISHCICTKDESICDLEDCWWFALAAKTTSCSTEWFRTRSQNFQTRWARGYFFRFTSQNNIYSITLDVNANVIQTYSNFVGPRPFQIQPWYHSPASFEEGGLPI